MTKAMANVVNDFTKGIFNWLDWDSNFYTYQRSIKDSAPYQLYKDEDKTTIVLSGIGIAEEDIKVEVVHDGKLDYLIVTGETKVHNRNFNVNYRFSLDATSVKSVDWQTKDGVITVIVNFLKAEKPKVQINKI